MLSFLKKIFFFITNIRYLKFNIKFLSRIYENKGTFEEILQFPRRSRKFVSKVFASEESLSCFKLFLSAHKKNKEVYNKDNIKNIFIDLTVSKDETKLIELLLNNDIPIYEKNTTELSIKNILRIGINKQDQSFFETLLPLYKENKITLSSIQKIFSIDNALDRVKKLNKSEEIKENFRLVDFLSTCSVNKENIGKIFSYNDTAFNKIKNEDNRELLKLLLQPTTYGVDAIKDTFFLENGMFDKIRDIFSFDDDIFNKIKKNLKLTGCLLKYKFDVSDIKYLFSKENSCFEAIKKNPEQIIKYVSDHKLNFADIKEIDINEDESSIKLRVPKSQLSNPSVEGLTGQKMSK
ncbi:MAG: hypothetical protein U0X86_000168 [Wolbachia endosymbiont of Xenopsylla cheopis]